MEIFEAISLRHSYRGPFKEDPVLVEDLKKIVQAGIEAPSGKNEQTTSFVIINDSSILKEIREMKGGNKAIKQGKAMIACIIDIEPEPIYHGHSFQVEDCAAAAENMLLAITALGYASVWIDGWLRLDDNAQKIGKLIGLPQGKVVRILLPIGIPVESWEQKKKKSFEERAWFNHYQG